MKGEEGSVIALIAEVVRVGQLSQVSVQKHTSLLNLKEKSEDVAGFLKLSPEAMLLRLVPLLLVRELTFVPDGLIFTSLLLTTLAPFLILE